MKGAKSSRSVFGSRLSFSILLQKEKQVSYLSLRDKLQISLLTFLRLNYTQLSVNGHLYKVDTSLKHRMEKRQKENSSVLKGARDGSNRKNFEGHGSWAQGRRERVWRAKP